MVRFGYSLPKAGGQGRKAVGLGLGNGFGFGFGFGFELKVQAFCVLCLFAKLAKLLVLCCN